MPISDFRPAYFLGQPLEGKTNFKGLVIKVNAIGLRYGHSDDFWAVLMT
jgi:hypothetical protein